MSKYLDFDGLKYSFTKARNTFASKEEVPTNLSELNDDSAHRTVTDTEKERWNSPGESVESLSTDDIDRIMA